MTKRILINSYFSQPTDLAAGLRQWPEFVNGSGFNVDLQDAENQVTVRYVGTDEEGEVVITGNGILFDRTVGYCIYALAADTDYLQVRRRENKEN